MLLLGSAKDKLSCPFFKRKGESSQLQGKKKIILQRLLRYMVKSNLPSVKSRKKKSVLISLSQFQTATTVHDKCLLKVEKALNF